MASGGTGLQLGTLSPAPGHMHARAGLVRVGWRDFRVHQLGVGRDSPTATWGYRPTTSGPFLQRAGWGPACDTPWKLKGTELETQAWPDPRRQGPCGLPAAGESLGPCRAWVSKPARPGARPGAVTSWPTDLRQVTCPLPPPRARPRCRKDQTRRGKRDSAGDRPAPGRTLQRRDFAEIRMWGPSGAPRTPQTRTARSPPCPEASPRLSLLHPPPPSPGLASPAHLPQRSTQAPRPCSWDRRGEAGAETVTLVRDVRAAH